MTVLAQPRFDELSHESRIEGHIELGARLLDDAGKPLPNAKVSVESRGASPIAELSSCDAAAAARGPRRRDTLDSVSTDAAGKLCVRVVSTSREGKLELRFGGDSLHLPARAEVPLQPTAAQLRLAFDAPTLELDLAQATHRLHLEVSGVAAGAPFPEIELTLNEGGRERVLAVAEWVRSGDTLTFDVSSAELGAPGPARLVASYRGSDRLAPAQAEAVALRTAPVRLEANDISISESGAELRIAAATPAGAPTSGWVEASVNSDPVGSSSFVAGFAELRVALPDPPSTPLTLRYRADDPWWVAGEPLSLVLERPTPRAPARWPWLVLLAPIGYVCLRSLQRPALRKGGGQNPPARRAPALRVEPRPSASGWTGTVVDAHEGGPIAGARVEVLLPSLRATSSALSIVTDVTGAFHFPPLPHPLPEGALLRVSAALHTEVERPLPPQGRVDVALVSRRRVLLRRLVRWARAGGPPWARSEEPTPAEVADVALRRGDARAARWAEGIEAAAFGDTDVDQAVEATLRAQEPPWQHKGQQSEAHDDDD